MDRMFFTQLIERFLNQRLQKYVKKSLTQDVLHEVYKDIKMGMFEIFSKCEFDLTEKSKLYVIDSLFKSLTVNGDEDQFKNSGLLSSAKPKDLPDNDIDLLISLFEPSKIEEELKEEKQRRK
tara:strand:+ start:4585 stop:4950 length:366 start_codon:yes stop_codon:yes gene_type:complete